MRLRAMSLAAGLFAVAAASLPSNDARACGGCFAPVTETESTVVTGHRMAFSISTTQTVLWDQIKYSGSPSDFAWVLPVKSGAVIQLASDAWFETLDAATSAQIQSPPVFCGSSGSSGCGIGCGASANALDKGEGGDEPPVTVVHQGTIGPYETVTLHANVPGALPSWLTANKYNLDPSVAPIINAYTAEGFDFIALRLQPGKGVQQMKPVRVVTAGMSPALPLRMVAAGTGANVAITLFVIGEGRWEAQNFSNGSVDVNKLTWDFPTQSSNYAEARQALLAQGGGKTWNNAYAQQGALLSNVGFGASSGFGPQGLSVGAQFYSVFADAYVNQGVLNGEANTASCLDPLHTLALSPDQVSGLCLGGGGAGGGGTGGGGTGGAGTGGAGTGGTGGGGGGPCTVPSDQIDARQLACGGLDDLAVSLVGLHPADVWLTRLEANLPRAALADDLSLQAAASQVSVSNVFSLTQSTGDPCAPSASAAAALTTLGGRGSGPRNRLALGAAILAAVGAFVGRRRRRAPALAYQR